MDLAKIIELRNQLVADATAALERRGVDRDALSQPVDVQAEQAARVRERIEGLERRKAEIVASLDAEVEALTRDLEAREQRIETERSAEGDAAAAPSPDRASGGRTKGATAPAAKTAPAADKKTRAAPSKGK